MNRNVRHIVIAVVTFIPGLYFFLEFVLPEKIGEFQFGLYHDAISRGVVVVGTMAIGLGLINILRVHGTAILKTRKRWGNSLALIIGLLVMLGVEGTDFVNSEKSVSAWKRITTLEAFSKRVRSDFAQEKVPAGERVKALIVSLDAVVSDAEAGRGFLSLEGEGEAHEQASQAFLESAGQVREAAVEVEKLYEEQEASGYFPGEGDLAVFRSKHRKLEAKLKIAAEAGREVAHLNYEGRKVRKAAHFLQHAFFIPLGAAMFSLLAFYIANAAYRSFRVRSLEALIMMLAALVVMLGQIPHGPLYVWDGLPMLRLWLLENLNTPAFRAIFFGAAIAGLAMAVRMWLSLEKSPLATEDNG